MSRLKLAAGLRVTSLGTLASRVLGMVRDMATAALFGLSGGGVMDAFVVAFRIPNLFRRLFGEGALAVSYLPVLAAQLEKDRRSAWQLASVTFTWLAVVLALIVLLGEAALAALGSISGEMARTRLTLGLAAMMMPYLLLICLTAHLSATLHALSHFTMPALAPVVLNICWLIGVWVIAPKFAPDKHAQAYVLAGCVLVAGLLQLAMQLPPLIHYGFRFDYNWGHTRRAVIEIAGAMAPMMLGLAATQLNTLADALLAWGLSSTPETGETIGWLSGAVAYPMSQGAAAALYYGERLYQFPLGILGVAVATVIFPLLSRHAARGDLRRLGADLTLGLRLVVLWAVPASAGLILLAYPVTVLLFERGAFTAEDSRRTARMIACYGTAVWAFCALPVLIRGYYALGDRVTPVRLGAATVGLNLGLSLILVWPLGEAGLAIATAISAAAQATILAVVFTRRSRSLGWRQLGRTAWVATLASALMAAACAGTLWWLPPSGDVAGRLAAVVVPLAASLAVYLAVIRFLFSDQWPLMWAAEEADESEAAL